MAVGNVELMHECFPKHLRMGIAGIKLDNDTEEGVKRRVNKESTAGENTYCPDSTVPPG